MSDPKAAWLKGTPASPILPLESQTLLAILTVIIAVISTGAFIVGGKRNITASVLYALVASVAGGFGLVFVTNAVHVYTG